MTRPKRKPTTHAHAWHPIIPPPDAVHPYLAMLARTCQACECGDMRVRPKSDYPIQY